MATGATEALRTRLLLLCRGPVEWGAGRADDPPLSPQGRLDAELLGGTLPPFEVVLSGPERAGVETAQALLVQRPVAAYQRDDLAEISTSARVTDAASYHTWLDRLFESYALSADGESLADGAERLRGALRAIADRFYGRSALVVAHPIVALAFRGALLGIPASRDQVDGLPDLALMVLDYLAGRFYLVQDFPVRHPI